MEQLNRKTRRLLQFGKPEEQAAVRAQISAAAPKILKENESGLVIVPVIGRFAGNIEEWMIPYKELDSKYCAFNASMALRDATGGNTPAHYYRMLSDKYYSGLSFLKFNLKDNVVSQGADVPVNKAFMLYLFTILSDWGSSHEHKMAYCTYIIDTCCTSIEWTKRETVKE